MKASTLQGRSQQASKLARVRVQKTDLKADAAIQRFAKTYCVIRNQLQHIDPAKVKQVFQQLGDE